MSTASNRPAKARLGVRIDPETNALIEQAARQLRLSKTAFISQTLREASMRVVARADVTMMAAADFDQLMASLETPDHSPELEELLARPTQIGR